jgi:uncharacterized protein (TIGR02145 family)
MKTSFTYLCKNFGKAIAFLTAAIFSFLFLVGCEKYEAPTVETVSARVVSGGTPFWYEHVYYPDGRYIQATGKIISDGNMSVYERGLCMSAIKTLPTVEDTLAWFVSDGAVFSGKFMFLEKNKTYYVRAYARNSIGIGYGEVKEVVNGIPAIVTTIGATALNRTEATMRASVDPQLGQAEVWFEVWRDGESVRRLDVPSVSGDKAVEVSATVGGLTAGEEYYYTLKAKNSTGTVSGEAKTFRLYYERVYDKDGNGYWTVKIGDQIWLAENLRTKHFLNGDPIPNVQADADWVAMKSPAYCYTKNDPILGGTYGCLYNNYVGLDQRGLIEGYRTPGIQDFEILVSYNGGGTAAARKLKSATDDWYDGRKGDNSSGFNALPGGWRRDGETPFSTLYYQAVFQTTSLMQGVGAYYDIMIYGSGYVATFYASAMDRGRNIRLIKN